MNYELKEIPVEKILLDPENPRHDISADQPIALKEMVNDQREKLLNLAQDILDNGINPSELLITIPYGDHYVGLEGNRRLAVLKLLSNPNLIELEPKVSKFFIENSKEFSKNPILNLRCVVYKNREATQHWIQLRHTGQNEGRGIVGWNAKAVARFGERLGHPSLALQAVEFVKKNTTLDESTKNKLKKVPLTNIERLVSDPYVRNTLGIDVEDRNLVTKLPPEEVIKGLSKIVTDVANEIITVNNIRLKSDRKSYIDETVVGDDSPKKGNVTKEYWALASKLGPVTPNSIQTQKPGSAKKVIPLSVTRKTLIPSNCILKIKNDRLNKIYRELRDLKVDDFENCGAVLLRVFLELSLEEYAKTNGITLKEEMYLATKFGNVVKCIETKKLMTQNELKPIHVALGNKNNLFSAHTLNAYVHDLDFTPKAKELKQTWNDVQRFFEIIWK